MSSRRKFEFEGSHGEQLAALLETPDKEPVATALFAHCFTCGKDIAAASRISRALVQRGYAVMRFDFTGLGNSDADFSNTKFSSNVRDVIDRDITLQGDLDDEQQKRLMAIADKCPVHRTLTGQMSIETRQITE